MLLSHSWIKFLGVALLLGCLLSNCARVPAQGQVKQDFLKEHPNYTIISIVVGEGDSSAAYFHIKYKKPGDEMVFEDVWQYLDNGKGELKLAHKETLKIDRR